MSQQRDRLDRCFDSQGQAAKCLAELVPSTYTHACDCGRANCKRCNKRRTSADYDLDYVLVDYWTDETSPMVIGGLNRSREWVVLQIPISVYRLRPAENRIINRQLFSQNDAKSMIQRLYDVLASNAPGTRSSGGVLVAPEEMVRNWRDKQVALVGRTGTIQSPAAEPVCANTGMEGGQRTMYFDPFLKRCFVFTSPEQARLVELLNRQPAGYVTVLQDTNKTKILLAYTVGPRGETTAVIPQVPLIRAKFPIKIPELMQLRLYAKEDEPAWLAFINDQNSLGQTVSLQDFYIWLSRETDRIHNWTESLGGEKQYCTQVLSLGWDDQNGQCAVQPILIPPPSLANSAAPILPPDLLPPLERVTESELKRLPPVPISSSSSGPLQIVAIWADPLTEDVFNPSSSRTRSNGNLLQRNANTSSSEYAKLAWLSDGRVIVINPPTPLTELTSNPQQLQSLIIRPGASTQIVFQRLLSAVYDHLSMLPKSDISRSIVQTFPINTQDSKWNVIVEPTAAFRAQLNERIRFIQPALKSADCVEGRWNEDKRMCVRVCPPGFLIDGNNCLMNGGGVGAINNLTADNKYVNRQAKAEVETARTRLVKAQKALDDYVTQNRVLDEKAVSLQRVVDYAQAESNFEDTVQKITDSIDELQLDSTDYVKTLIDRLKQRNPKNLQEVLEDAWNALKMEQTKLGISQPTTAQLGLYNHASEVLIKYANRYNALVSPPPSLSPTTREQKYIDSLVQVINELKKASNAVNTESATLLNEQIAGKVRDVQEMEKVDDLYRAFADKLDEALIMRQAIENDPLWKGEPAAVPNPLRGRIQQLLTDITVYVELNVPYVERLRNSHEKFNAYLPVCLRTNPDETKESRYEDRISMVYAQTQPGGTTKIQLGWNQCGQWIVPVDNIDVASLGVDLPNIMFYRGRMPSRELEISIATARALPKNGMGAGTKAQPFKALTSVVIREIREGAHHFAKITNRLCSAYAYTGGGTDIANCVSVCLPNQQYDADSKECKARPTETPSPAGPIAASTAPPVLDLPIEPADFGGAGTMFGRRPPPPPPPRPPVALIPASRILTAKSVNKERKEVYDNIKSEAECQKAGPDGLGYWNGTNCVPCGPDYRWDGYQCIRKTVIIPSSEQPLDVPEAPPAPDLPAEKRVCNPLTEDYVAETNECKDKPLKKPPPPREPRTRNETKVADDEKKELDRSHLLAQIQMGPAELSRQFRRQAYDAKDPASCDAAQGRWTEAEDKGVFYCDPCRDKQQQYDPESNGCVRIVTEPTQNNNATPKEVQQEGKSILDALKDRLGQNRAFINPNEAKLSKAAQKLQTQLKAINYEKDVETFCDKIRRTRILKTMTELATAKNVPLKDGEEKRTVPVLCMRIWEKIHKKQ